MQLLLKYNETYDYDSLIFISDDLEEMKVKEKLCFTPHNGFSWICGWGD